MRFLFVFGLMSLILSSCSMVRKTTVSMTSDVLWEGSREIETEADWHLFREAIGPNLKLMEGLLAVKPTDTNLLISLVKGYSAYGFGVHETLYLDEQLKDAKASNNLDRAIYSYSKAIDYGVKFLEQQGVVFSKLMEKQKVENGIIAYLDDELSNKLENIEAVFFLGQSLGGLINLQKKNMSLLSQLPIVKGLIDWSCSKKPDFQFGACSAFYGAYEAGRPKMLGGDIEKAQDIFKKAIEQYPMSLINRVAYIQYYIIPMMDEDEFENEVRVLDIEFQKFEDSKNWANGFGSYGIKEVSLLNAIAKERYEIIKKNKKNIF